MIVTITVDFTCLAIQKIVEFLVLYTTLCWHVKDNKRSHHFIEHSYASNCKKYQLTTTLSECLGKNAIFVRASNLNRGSPLNDTCTSMNAAQHYTA